MSKHFERNYIIQVLCRKIPTITWSSNTMNSKWRMEKKTRKKIIPKMLFDYKDRMTDWINASISLWVSESIFQKKRCPNFNFFGYSHWYKLFQCIKFNLRLHTYKILIFYTHEVLKHRKYIDIKRAFFLWLLKT